MRRWPWRATACETDVLKSIGCLQQHLLEALLDSIPTEVAKAWNAEALRRAEAFEHGEVQATDGDRAMNELRTKLGEARGA